METGANLLAWEIKFWAELEPVKLVLIQNQLGSLESDVVREVRCIQGPVHGVRHSSHFRGGRAVRTGGVIHSLHTLSPAGCWNGHLKIYHDSCFCALRKHQAVLLLTYSLFSYVFSVLNTKPVGDDQIFLSLTISLKCTQLGKLFAFVKRNQT